MKAKELFRNFLFELVIVFLGVLGAFFVERIIQSNNSRQSNIQNLEMLFGSIKDDTVRINSIIRLPSIEERILLINRFSDHWLPKNLAPRDSLDLLLNYLTIRLLRWDLVNYEVMEMMPEMNEMVNKNLKFKVLNYFKLSKAVNESIQEISRNYADVIFREVDISQFGFALNGAPKINPLYKNRSIRIDKYLSPELKNRCIRYRYFAESTKVILLNLEHEAESLLADIKKEINK